MSTFAFDENNVRHDAANGKPGCIVYCHECREEVFYVKGYTYFRGLYQRQAHFRHSQSSECAIAKHEAQETEEHLSMKDMIASAFDVVQEEKLLPDKSRRPDLVVRGRDGVARAVECQHSPIEIDTVAGRIKDHNAAGLPSMWALSPARLRNNALSIWDGVTETLYSIVTPDDPLTSRVLRIDPSARSVALAYAICHIAYIDSPSLISVEIDLPSHPLVDVSNRGKQITVPEHDQDGFSYALKKKLGRHAWNALGEHRRFVEYSEMSKERAANSDEDFDMVWRRNMEGFAADERKQFQGIDAIKPKDVRAFCSRIEKANYEAAQQEAQRRAEIERQERAAEHARRAAEIEAQRQRVNHARNAIRYAEPLIGATGNWSDAEKRTVRITIRRYADALGINLTGAVKIGQATRILVREAHKIANEGSQ